MCAHLSSHGKDVSRVQGVPFVVRNANACLRGNESLRLEYMLTCARRGGPMKVDVQGDLSLGVGAKGDVGGVAWGGVRKWEAVV